MVAGASVSRDTNVNPEATTLDAAERKVILAALEKFEWNQTRAASYLGVTRKILRGRLAKYGIRRSTLSQAAPG
jgi:DNA-binding NtrC family response regulator